MLRNPDLVSGAEQATVMAQLIAQTDGSMIPKVEVDTQTEGDRRNTRQVGWKEVRLSLVYKQGTLQPVVGATTGGPEQAGDQLAWYARHIEMGPQTQVHALGDGAPWIVDQMERVFGAQGTYLIDFYHLCDYLAAARKSCASDAQGWYTIQNQGMKAGQCAEVLQALEPHQESPSVDDEHPLFGRLIVISEIALTNSITQAHCKPDCPLARARSRVLIDTLSKSALRLLVLGGRSTTPRRC